ncbi:hypothetical protein TELCIR_17221 [Teladorsagia circumcincta]|uniref:Uncharacterized protein n=1 Tax=Teladorsagia circumcincta TaxID=45464 RepID=A0A2G9TTC8_TELCI|nr:hypothetical protein TELCIR_17221 [Teladorsagia circumcincta]
MVDVFPSQATAEARYIAIFGTRTRFVVMVLVLLCLTSICCQSSPGGVPPEKTKSSISMPNGNPRMGIIGFARENFIILKTTGDQPSTNEMTLEVTNEMTLEVSTVKIS